MSYGTSGHVTIKDIDTAILRGLKGACKDGNVADFKGDVDTLLSEMFKKAASEPLVSAIIKDNGLNFLTDLQGQTAWAYYLMFKDFCFMFQSFVVARKNWEKEVKESRVSLTLYRNIFSKTSNAITEFLKTIGDKKWGGLDAEIELLKAAERL